MKPPRPPSTQRAITRLARRVRNLERRYIDVPDGTGVTVETLYCDSSDAAGVTTSLALDDGISYLIEIQGTYSAWNLALDVGDPEADAMFPGSTSGRISTEVGIDAATMFAYPSSEPLGAIGSHNGLTFDLGAGAFTAIPDDGSYTTPAIGHLYRYTVTGEGSALTVLINDSGPYTDNYGRLRVTVKRMGAGSSGGGGGGSDPGTGSLLPPADSSLDGDVLAVDGGVAAWKPMSEILETGLLAARPAANSVLPGSLYAATDDGHVYQSNGTAWSVWATLGSGTGGSSLGWVNVKDHGAHGDVTTVGVDGTDDTAAFNAALAALPTVNGSPAGTIYLPAGAYRIDSPINNLGPYVSVLGDGKYASILDYRGSGDCLRAYDSTYPSGEFWGGSWFGGSMREFCIDGTGAGAGAVGLHAGDLTDLRFDLLVSHFFGDGSTGVLFDNSISWTERLGGRITVQDCTNAVTFTVSGTGQSTQSFFYSDLTIDLLLSGERANGPQNGVTFENGAMMVNSHLRIIGNMYQGAGSADAAALTVTGQVPGVSFRSAATNQQSTGTTIAINKPAGVQSGDVLVAVIQTGGSSNLPTGVPSGWTLLDSGSTGPSVATYYKVAGSSEPSSYSWTYPTGTFAAAGVIAAYSGCDPVSPINTHGALNRSTTAAATANTITTTAPCKLIFVTGIGNDPDPNTLPSGFTLRGRAYSAGVFAEAYLLDEDQVDAGATAAVTLTQAGADNSYSGLIALKPAGSHPSPNAYANLTGVHLDIQVEVGAGGGSSEPQTIKFGAAGNFIIGTGILSFQQGGGRWAASNNSGNLQKWLGMINGDAALNSHNDWTPVAVGGLNNP